MGPPAVYLLITIWEDVEAERDQQNKLQKVEFKLKQQILNI